MYEKNNPTVSVVMACYKVEDYLREAIESVLKQDFLDFEFIIVNDASPDNSLAIAEEYKAIDSRIIVIDSKNNLGCFGARNVGLKAAKGKYVAIFDSDDVCMPERLSKQVRYLNENPDIFLISCSFYYINEKGEIINKQVEDLQPVQVDKILPRKNVVHDPTVMFRNVGLLYREKFYAAGDYDLWLRMLNEHRLMAVLPEVVIKYRIQSKSVTNSNYRKFLYCIKKARVFYRQRLKWGIDKYDYFNPDKVVSRGQKNEDEGLVLSREIKFFFKNYNEMRELRLKIRLFWRNYNFSIWPCSFCFYLISYLPHICRTFFKKILWP